MSKLLCNVLKISGGKMPPLVARLIPSTPSLLNTYKFILLYLGMLEIENNGKKHKGYFTN